MCLRCRQAAPCWLQPGQRGKQHHASSVHALWLQVVDVFAMPQSGTGVSVEAVDPVFQTKMLDMLKQVGR